MFYVVTLMILFLNYLILDPPVGVFMGVFLPKKTKKKKNKKQPLAAGLVPPHLPLPALGVELLKGTHLTLIVATACAGSSWLFEWQVAKALAAGV